jgi:DNA-binding NarL/FixJ family response regulator
VRRGESNPKMCDKYLTASEQEGPDEPIGLGDPLRDRLTADSGRVRVVLGQFGTVVGLGLREVLSRDPGLDVLGEDLGHADLEAAVAQLAPRVAVLGEASAVGRSIFKRLCVIQPDVGIVVLAHGPTRAYGARLLGSGVAVCLSIEASAPEIVGAIRLAAEGKQALASAADASIQAARYTGMASLTPREREVLRLLSLGEPNAEIAQKLQISTETARTHVRHILGKFGVGRRQELVGIVIPDRFE